MFQWFPGHMAKAMKEIKEKQIIADIFVIVLDARAPISTYNEEFDKIAPHKPRLFIITKKDLADMNKIPQIVKRFQNDSTNNVLVVNLKKSSTKKEITNKILQLLQPKIAKDKLKGFVNPRLRVFVMGIPNSGKSTLINLLGNAKTKVGNMPGVTKGQQWINANGIMLLDTPGILWPKSDNPETGVKVAIIGSIKWDIIPTKILFNEAYKLVSKYYPEHIINLGLEPTQDETEIYNNLYKLCFKKYFLINATQPNLEKGMKWFNLFVRDLKGVTYD